MDDRDLEVLRSMEARVSQNQINIELLQRTVILLEAKIQQEIERELVRTRKEEAWSSARANGFWGGLFALVVAVVSGIIMNMQNLAQLIVHSNTK